MASIIPRFVVVLVGLGVGVLSAQTDSTPVRKDSAPAVGVSTTPDTTVKSSPASIPVVTPVRNDTVQVAIPISDTVKPPVAPEKVATDSQVAKPEAVKKPIVKSDAVAKRCEPPKWALEGGVRYGWRMGELLDEENRLTNQFKVVLLGADDDTSTVDPIASGVAYQAVVWLKAHCGNQFGLGFQYGQFSEHPTTSYSLDLTESLLESFLVTGRYRHVKPVASSVGIFGEAALGWNHSTLHRIPLVAAHIGDAKLKFSNSDKDLIAAVNRESSTDGIHAEAGIGGELALSPAWSLALTANATWDKVWLQASSDEIEADYSTSPSYWGFDIGLSVAREF